MAWIREMRFQDVRKHVIDYQFVCQTCNKPSGVVSREIVAEQNQTYPGHFTFSPQDHAAFPFIMQNYLVNMLLMTWIAYERGEYSYNNYVGQWSPACPHCGAKQKWEPKKKLFQKPEPIDPAYLPSVNWHWEALSVNVPARIEWLKREKPDYIYDKKKYPLSDPQFGLSFTLINDDENSWRYVVPGLRLDLTKDLMAEAKPPYYVINPTSYNFDASLPKHNRPEFNTGEESYGFISIIDGSPMVRWAIGRNGVVERTVILPFDK